MNIYCKQIQSFDEIPDLSYEGYIWISDENTPRIITGKSELIPFQGNPFIVEGQMKSTDGSTSVSIKDAGGVQLIHQYNLNAIDELPKEQKTELSLLVHRLNDIKKIKFTTVWLPEIDEACESMEVLKPAMRVFNGFELKK